MSLNWSMSNYLEQQIATHLFRTSSWTKPTNLAIALCTGQIQETATGETLPEVANAGNYARVSLAPLDANWGPFAQGDSPNSSGQLGNASAITFAAASAPWAQVTHLALVDSGTYGAGNLFMFGPLSEAKTVGTSDTFSIAISGVLAKFD